MTVLKQIGTSADGWEHCREEVDADDVQHEKREERGKYGGRACVCAVPVMEGRPKCALIRYSLLPEYCLMLQIMASRSGKYVTVPERGRMEGREGKGRMEGRRAR